MFNQSNKYEYDPIRHGMFSQFCFFLSVFVEYALFFFWSGSLVARIHLIRWISGVSRVRTPAPAYNNALSYQLSYAYGTVEYALININFVSNLVYYVLLMRLMLVEIKVKQNKTIPMDFYDKLIHYNPFFWQLQILFC